MLKYAFVLYLVASCYAGSTVPAMRLRGGGPLSWKNLVKQPDALKEGYSTETKLEVNTKSDLNDGTSIKTTFLRKAADTVSHITVAKTSIQDINIEATVDGSGRITAEATKRDLIPGAELSISADLDGGQKLKDIRTPRLNAEYRRDNVAANFEVKGATLDAAAVVESGDVQIGLSAVYDAEAGKLSDPSLAARYQGSGFSITAVSKGLKGDDLSATYAQAVNDKLDVAGTFSSAGNKFALAGAYKLDADSSVRGKVDSDGQVNVGYTRQVTKGASLTAGLEVDSHNIDKRKFGVSLKLQ